MLAPKQLARNVTLVRGVVKADFSFAAKELRRKSTGRTDIPRGQD
jgi:hypothetical protein